MNRRGFFAAVSAIPFGLLWARRLKPNPPERSYRFGYGQTNFLRPPGAIEEERFLESCINCELCGQACPIEVIVFFTGDLGGKVRAHTPYIVAADRACDLCLECTHVCPTGALRPVARKTDVRMGTAVIEENLCLPYIRQGICGACYTICPVNAVRLEMQRYPKVDEERCVGCGLCEEVCLQSVKAIRVFPPTAET